MCGFIGTRKEEQFFGKNCGGGRGKKNGFWVEINNQGANRNAFHYIPTVVCQGRSSGRLGKNNNLSIQKRGKTQPPWGIPIRRYGK